MSRWPVVLLFVLVLTTAGPSHADSILLKNGRVMNGTVIKETPTIVVILIDGLGKMGIERCRIDKVLRDGASSPAPRPVTRKPAPGKAPSLVPSGPVPTAAIPRGVGRDILTSFRQGLPAKGGLPAEHLRSHVNRFELLGRKVTGDLSQVLSEDEDWRLRLLAARVLKLVVDPAATAALIHALGDRHYGAIAPDPDQPAGRIRGGFVIRLEAVAGLKAIGLEAFQGLMATAGDGEHPDQAVAIQGLAEVDVPGRATLLARLAKDRALALNARRLAVKGLAKQGPAAAEVLAELLPDTDVRPQVEQSLKATRDPAAIPGLMRHVRTAAEDHELARRAAQAIAWIQSSYLPSSLEDAVDFMLLSYQIDRIGTRLGAPALSRLRFWANSDCESMKKVAGRALSSFSTSRRPTPKPRPAQRPRRPSG